MPDRFRKELRDKPFTILDNVALRDPRLSLRARGLLVTCLSLPPDWSFSVRGLAALCKEGKDAVGSALIELEKAGYLRRNQMHGEGGAFGCTEYVFYEEAQPCPENPDTAKPDTAKPDTANPPQQKKEEQKKDIINPPKPPRGRAAKKAPDHLPEEFVRLWRAYPRGDDKQGAIREWDRLKPDEATIFAMKSALLLQMQSDEWQRGIGIPYFCRWLSHRRWEDERIRSGSRAAAPVQSVEAPPEVAAW